MIAGHFSFIIFIVNLFSIGICRSPAGNDDVKDHIHVPTSSSTTIWPLSFPFNKIWENEEAFLRVKECTDNNPCSECIVHCFPIWTSILKQQSKFGGRYSLRYFLRITSINGIMQWPNISLSAVPILFVPGSGGSFNDFGNIISQWEFSKFFHLFALDFEQEPTAYDTDFIEQQAAFIIEAIGYIRFGLNSSKKTSADDQTMPKIVLIAHSMGGVSAKAALIASEGAGKDVAFSITLNSPISEAPFYFDSRFVNLYDKLNRNKTTIPIISINSGLADRIIDKEWTIPKGPGQQFSFGIAALDGATNISHNGILKHIPLLRRISHFIFAYSTIDEANFFGNFSLFVSTNFNFNSTIIGMDQQEIGDILTEKFIIDLMANFWKRNRQIVPLSFLAPSILFSSRSWAQLNLRTIILPFIVFTFLQYRSLHDFLLLASISHFVFFLVFGFYLGLISLLNLFSKLKFRKFSMAASLIILLNLFLNICLKLILASIILYTLLTWKTFLLVPCMIKNIQQIHHQFGDQLILASAFIFLQLVQFAIAIIIPYKANKLFISIDSEWNSTFMEQFFSADPFWRPNLLLAIFTLIFCHQKFLNRKIKHFGKIGRFALFRLLSNLPFKEIILELFLIILAIFTFFVHQQSQIPLDDVSLFNVLFLIILVINSSNLHKIV